MKQPDGYVTKADSLQIRVVAIEQSLVDQLKKIGFVFDHDLSVFVLNVKDQNEKADVFLKLRDVGVCFSAGKEWSPAELFEYFRELQLVSGVYKRISWLSPGEWRVESL